MGHQICSTPWTVDAAVSQLRKSPQLTIDCQGHKLRDPHVECLSTPAMVVVATIFVCNLPNLLRPFGVFGFSFLSLTSPAISSLCLASPSHLLPSFWCFQLSLPFG